MSRIADTRRPRASSSAVQVIPFLCCGGESGMQAASGAGVGRRACEAWRPCDGCRSQARASRLRCTRACAQWPWRQRLSDGAFARGAPPLARRVTRPLLSTRPCFFWRPDPFFPSSALLTLPSAALHLHRPLLLPFMTEMVRLCTSCRSDGQCSQRDDGERARGHGLALSRPERHPPPLSKPVIDHLLTKRREDIAADMCV